MVIIIVINCFFIRKSFCCFMNFVIFKVIGIIWFWRSWRFWFFNNLFLRCFKCCFLLNCSRTCFSGNFFILGCFLFRLFKSWLLGYFCSCCSCYGSFFWRATCWPSYWCFWRRTSCLTRYCFKFWWFFLTWSKGIRCVFFFSCFLFC